MAFEKRNIIFDLGGILLNIYPQRTFAAFADMGVDPSLLTEKYSLSNSTMLAFEQGNISPDELCAYIAEMLPSTMKKQSVEELNRQIIDAWCALIGELPLYKWQRITELRNRGYKVFLLSNTNAIHWERIAKNIEQVEGRSVDDYFDGIFLSYEMHLCKPCEEIFRRVLAEAGLLASETLFIDDSADNCAAAGRVGIESIVIDRNSHWSSDFLNDK